MHQGTRKEVFHDARPKQGDHPGAGGETAAREPVTEPLSCPRQSALDGADWPAEVTRGLLVGISLEVAEDHGRPESLGKPVDLLVQQVPQVVLVFGV